ncbi:MAG: hemolysin family protein [Bacteroidetes bacterium]|nr:hemolysin family protein [Bacteroidota bacterium]
MLIQIFVILFLILLNGVFAMAEMAIVSANKIRLQHLSNKGNKNAKIILELISVPERFLSTIQIGITIIGLLTGAIGFTFLSDDLKLFIDKIPVLNLYANWISYFIIIITITFVSLVIGELVPKKIALHYSERVALFLARPLLIVEKFLKPMVKLLSSTTWLISKSFNISSQKENPMTQEELNLLIELGIKAGIFKKTEHEIVEGTLKLKNYKVTSFMIPRYDVIGIRKNSTKEQIKKIIFESQFSNYPVFEETFDNIISVLNANKFLLNFENSEFDIADYSLTPIFVPETLSVLEAINHFRTNKSKISFVVDEYGSFQGLITLNMIVENILGILPVVEEIEEEQIIKRTDGSLLIDGAISIQKLKESLNLNFQTSDDSIGEFSTLSGFIFSKLGKVPTSAEFFIWENYKFEVIYMDGNRIDKVLISTVSNQQQNN